MLEREVKLSAPARFRMPDLGGVVEGSASSPAEELLLRTVYWDTPDLRLARSGCTLRYRAGEGWNVKLPSSSAGALLSRPELVFEGSPRRPAPEALELMAAQVRGDRLVPVARLRTVRRRIVLHDQHGERLAEVVDDEVTVLDGHRVAQRFRELEIELAEGVPESVLATCVERLEGAGASVAEPTPKLIRALGPAALGHSEVEAGPLADGAGAGAVVAGALAASTARLLRHDPGVFLGEDPEDVHQARVALRRIRSDLRTFRPLVDQDWAARIRSEAGWFGGLLGAVRDAEVLLARLRAAAAELGDDDRQAAGVLLAKLDETRSAAREQLLAARRTSRFTELVELLVEASAAPALTPAADTRGDDIVPSLVGRAWRRLRRAHAELGGDPPDTALHDLRILVKRLRYAAEAAVPVVGRRASRLARAAARLQDVLGEHQDATIAQDWLRSAARDGPPADAFVAGQVYVEEVRVAARAARRWPDAWERLADRGKAGWLKRDTTLPQEEPEPQAEQQPEEPRELPSEEPRKPSGGDHRAEPAPAEGDVSIAPRVQFSIADRPA